MEMTKCSGMINDTGLSTKAVNGFTAYKLTTLKRKVRCNAHIPHHTLSTLTHPCKQNGKVYCASCYIAMKSKTFDTWFLGLVDVSDLKAFSEPTRTIGSLCEWR